MQVGKLASKQVFLLVRRMVPGTRQNGVRLIRDNRKNTARLFSRNPKPARNVEVLAVTSLVRSYNPGT